MTLPTLTAPLPEVALTIGVLCLNFALLLGVPTFGLVRSEPTDRDGTDPDALATQRDSHRR